MKALIFAIAVAMAPPVAAQQAPYMVDAETVSGIVGTIFTNRNVNISGHEYFGGGYVGDTRNNIAVETYQNFRNHDYTLMIVKEIGRSGPHAVWRITDVTSLGAGPNDQMSRACAVGDSRHVRSDIIAIIRASDRVARQTSEHGAFYAARDAVRITPEGQAVRLSVSDRVLCADESYGV